MASTTMWQRDDWPLWVLYGLACLGVLSLLALNVLAFEIWYQIRF